MEEWVYIPPKYTKYCFVPICTNNSSKTPDKHFFHVPYKNKADWCRAVGKQYVPKCPLVICEDHLNLEYDLENYNSWKISKGKAKLRPKVPFLKKISKTTETITEDEPGPSRRSPESCPRPSFEECSVMCTPMIAHKSIQVKPIERDCFRTTSGNLRLKNTVNLSLVKKTFHDVAVQCQPDMRRVSVCAKPSVRGIGCLANIEGLPLDEKTLPSTPRQCKNVQSVPCMSSSTTTPNSKTDNQMCNTMHLKHVRDAPNPSSAHSVLTQATSQPIKEEIDTLIEIKMEFEDSETEFTKQNCGMIDSDPLKIGLGNCLESELATDKEHPVVTVEQFLKGCELYLTPELRDYVKTQIKRPLY